MKKLLLFLFVFTFLFFEKSNAQWIQTGPWTLGAPYSMTNSGSYLFVGTSGGTIFRSSNNGDNWSMIRDRTSLADNSIQSFAVYNNHIFFAQSKNGVFRTSNNGDSWERINNGLPTMYNGSPDTSVYSLRVKGNLIFAGTYAGLYVSSNAGASWSRPYSGEPNGAIARMALKENTIFVTNNSQTIYRSINDGVNWTQTTNIPAFATLLSLESFNNNIFAGTARGQVYRSTNDGTNWSLASNGLPGIDTGGNYVYALYGVDNNLFACLSKGVYLTKDNGASWINRNQGLGENFRSFLSIQMKNGYLHAGDSIRMWRRVYSEAIGIKNISSNVPEKFSLEQNYPNPFNPSTKINFSLPVKSFVNLRVYNSAGEQVANLVNENLSAGTYEYSFNGENLSSGIYFYMLETERASETKKMILLK